jgi:hypothetical protein
MEARFRNIMAVLCSRALTAVNPLLHETVTFKHR